MKIILVGGGKVGTALARQLSEEDHNVTIVDTNKARVEHLTESYDVLGIVGNGSSITTLAEAGIEDADVFIAVTGSDELNLLCCTIAKKAGGELAAIARVRNPDYSEELSYLRQQLGLGGGRQPARQQAESTGRRKAHRCSYRRNDDPRRQRPVHAAPARAPADLRRAGPVRAGVRRRARPGAGADPQPAGLAATFRPVGRAGGLAGGLGPG